MSRNIKAIYEEGIETRNKYLQLATDKTTSLSASKMSVINMMTYVMSSLIYTFENMLDVFLADATTVLNKRTTGTPAYYVFMAKQFSIGCTVTVNDDGTGIDVIDGTNGKLIPYASYETVTTNSGIVLKVCKDDNGNIVPLSTSELTEFTSYLKQIQFVGAPIVVRSVPADLITPKMRVIYDETIVSDAVVLDNIKTAIDNYAKGLTYDDYVYQSAIVDAVQSAYGVLDVPSTLINGTQSAIYVQKCNYSTEDGYDGMTELTGWYRPYSGYLTTLKDGATTINTTNIELQSRKQYLETKNQ